MFHRTELSQSYCLSVCENEFMLSTVDVVAFSDVWSTSQLAYIATITPFITSSRLSKVWSV